MAQEEKASLMGPIISENGVLSLIGRRIEKPHFHTTIPMKKQLITINLSGSSLSSVYYIYLDPTN